MTKSVLNRRHFHGPLFSSNISILITLHSSWITEISTLRSGSSIPPTSNRQLVQSVFIFPWFPQPISFRGKEAGGTRAVKAAKSNAATKMQRFPFMLFSLQNCPVPEVEPGSPFRSPRSASRCQSQRHTVVHAMVIEREPCWCSTTTQPLTRLATGWRHAADVAPHTNRKP